MYKHHGVTQFEGSSSELVAANCFTLVKEIERLNDLCTIARNLLATTRRAQNLAAERGFDQQILKLIDVCVKVTARGFDGTNVRTEERHQQVCVLFKRLLMTCLQYLHNFIMHNEHRKLVLWLDLFGYSQQAEAVASDGVTGIAHHKRSGSDADEDYDAIPNEARILDAVHNLSSSESSAGYNIEDVQALYELMSVESHPDQVTKDAAKLLMGRIRTDMERLAGMDADELDADPEALLRIGAVLRARLPSRQSERHESLAKGKGTASTSKDVSQAQGKTNQWSGLPDLSSYGSLLVDQEITGDDLAMPRTSRSAAETLQEAKNELMARLQDSAPNRDEQGDQVYGENGQILEPELEDEIPESAEDSVEEEEDDDGEDYHNANDQERGLLTDVPLVLGPSEIEALPMIIQAGIVDSFGSKGSDRQGLKNMQSVRCHILLAQEAGRNVLRELLIFIAAWDLPDDELYFKMMVGIMGAILKNGLMSHAYSDFGQAKDIISPAQAVVIKILTHIYRGKYSPSSSAQNSEQATPTPRMPEPPTRTDVLTVRYIFTVFRGNIIPETCALIYLQGQIRAGLAMAEDFPLNLWDMERVYEGVYQFLEFFAVLTENNDWKRLLIEWEIVYDLVTLLKELDASIPKAPFIAAASSNRQATSGAQTVGTPSTIVQSQPQSAATPTVERPYDLAKAPDQPPVPALPASSTPESQPRPQHPPSAPPPPTASPPPPTQSEDPSSFEWRNLKKLIVLVLSSLVWKSSTVQRQIREYDGVECILSCTNYDGHNPYIKEHALMCLKFLLEGNKENQEIVRSLEARGVANQAELEREFGVRARVDGQGRVQVNNGAPEPDVDEAKMLPRRNVRDRRASESNAAAELLGEKFARLNAEMGQTSISQQRGRVVEEVTDQDDDEYEFM